MKNENIEFAKIEDTKSRLQLAQWVLERNLAWIAATEVKIGVVVAIDTAMLGGLGAAYSAADSSARTAWANLFIYSAAFSLAVALFCAAMALLPRTTGPAKSLLFFGRIASLKEEEYVKTFAQATETELLNDWTVQIHRNAQIACAKFGWVHKSVTWSFLSIAPWIGAISLLLQK